MKKNEKIYPNHFTKSKLCAITAESGITLATLAITIVVLLILAGVTISAISGNESVMEKAQEAKEKTDISNEKKAIQLAVTNSMVGTYDVSIDIEKLKSGLNGIVENESINGITNEQTKYKVTGKTGQIYYIYDDGDVLTIDEAIEKATKLEITDPWASKNASNQWRVSTKFTSTVEEDFNIVERGYIYIKDKSSTIELKLENVGIDGVLKKTNTTTFDENTLNITDPDEKGSRRVGFITVSDADGTYSKTMYTREISAYYKDLPEYTPDT